jgi:membrane-associated phospholipid phosphatase
MSSRSYRMETPKIKAFALTMNRRILLAALVCCIQVLYIPTSARLSGGIEPRLPIDVVPIWPIWVVPYISCYLIWFAGFIWIIRNMEDRLFHAFIVACTVAFSLGVSTFIFFPTYIRAGSVPGSDIFASFLRFIHGNLGRYDAFPSGHVYITTLLALFYARWYPRKKLLWLSIVIIVSLSTLFTGQHYILDVLGGWIVALAGYHFGLWWAGFTPARKGTDKRPGRRIPSSSLD